MSNLQEKHLILQKVTFLHLVKNHKITVNLQDIWEILILQKSVQKN